MPEDILSDAATRARALDTRCSFIVEAPAGSGKTGLLIQRFLLLLAEGDVQLPEEVLAITFTRKATTEMQQRILKNLQLAAAPADAAPLSPFDQTTRTLAQKVLERNAELGWNILQQPQRLNIRTIDSLCSEISAHLPILSGLGGRLQPIDDARPLYAEAARRTLEALDSSDATIADALRLILLHRDGRLDECQSLLAEMLARRDQWARLIPLGRELDATFLDTTVRPRLEGVLREMIAAALQHASTLLGADDLRELSELAHLAAQELTRTGADHPFATCMESPLSPQMGAECLEHWRALSCLVITKSGDWRKSIDKRIGFPTTSKDKPRLLRLIERMRANEPLREALCALEKLPPAQYTDREWEVSKALFHFLHRGMAELQMVFAERRQCDFTELSIASVAALAGGDASLAVAMGMRFRHLLVDEMQDTSISQYTLLRRITQGWDGASQTVFLVGDPRQSIYLFRQARVEQFTRAITEHLLGDVPLEHLQLTANFRSHHALVAAFNTHFELIRPHQINAHDATPHTAARAEREIKTDRSTDADSAHIGLHWHPEIIQNDDKQQSREDSTKARKREAGEIAALVETWRQRKLSAGKPASIAVLVRVKSHLQQIALTLREKQIPYRAVEIEALAEQQEVLDALSLLRALLHPADRIAWLAVLRAPWCGLTVLDLHTLTGSDDPACASLCISELITARSSLLPALSRKHLLRTHAILAAAATQRGRLSLSQWVEGAWRSLGAPLYLDPAQTANVQSFFTLLDECEEQGDVLDANLLLERLQSLFAPDSQADDITVDLMTIHKAKGLEWDVVLVPSLDRRSGINTPPLLEWLENPATRPGESLALLAPIPSKNDQGPSLHSYVSGLRKQIQDMELRRVFYVAATRAREELHLFGQVTLSAKGLRPRASTLLDAAWPAAAQYFEAKQAAAPSAKLFILPAPPSDESSDATEASGGIVLQIAAASTPVAKPRTVRRLPATADIAALNAQQAGTPLPRGYEQESIPQREYRRAEGSLSARALGTVVHAYLDRIAQEFAAGATAASLQIESWLPGITAMLRSAGLPPTDVQHRAAQALAALRSTLDDAQGQWVLAPHPQAASEIAMSTWTAAGTLATYRMDRNFRAGAAPLQAGDNFLWIVDYKISAQDESTDPAILAVESEKHRSQLEAYARVQQLALTDAVGIRLAAFYPLRKSGEKLRVWEYVPSE